MGFSYLSAAEFIRHLRDLAKSLLSQTRLSRVVGLLERAEEGCEGLKHGYYDLPCVHFLIFLCHDIKNKIDRLVFIFMNKISRCRKKINLENRALLVVFLKEQN